jgi:non-ribosomal peptide synthetase component F
LPVSYGDYVLWQREWSQGPELARQVAFWQKALAGEAADLALPLDKERPAQANYAGANLALPLTRADADALTAVAHRANTTLFNVLFAAYCVLLHRYSGQTEIVVGTPVRARNLPEVENLIGPFINAVVLRSKVDPTRTFVDYLAEVRDLTLDAFSNQEMPLELLGTRPPIVRAFFSFQDARSRAVQLGSARVTQIDVEPPAAANDLMLWMMDRPSELLAVANFNSEVFTSETVARLLRSFVTLLRDIAVRPTLEIAKLSILSEVDREALSAGRARAQPERARRFAHDALVAAAAELPDAVAFAQGPSTLAYGSCAQRARALAHELRKRVEPGRVVAVALPRTPELVCVVFGAFMAGLTVMTLDLRAPWAYSRRLIAAGAPALLLTDDAHRAQLVSDGALDVLSLSELGGLGGDAQAPSLAGLDPTQQAAWLNVRFDAKREPVLSRIMHADLVERAQALAENIRSARRLQLSLEPLSESLPLELVLGCSLRAECVLASPDLASDELPANLSGDISAAIAPASAWANFVAAGTPAAPALTAVIYGRASAGLLERLLPLVGRVITVSVSPLLEAAFIHAPRAAHEASVLGKLVGAASVGVVDGSGGWLPDGAPGRLVLLAEHVVDLNLHGRRRMDGSFSLVADEGKTALVSGVRFDLSEIAHALAHHKAVSRAVARLELEDGGAPRLVAYFAHVPGQSFTDTELRRQLRSLLPELMVPQVFVELEVLPVTPEGAIDYARLPAPFGSDLGGEFVAPRSVVEQRLAQIFSEALRVPRVGIYDNFFDLGGHSLLCFRVIERIERELGKRLSPRTLLLNSLEQVASELDAGALKAVPEQPRAEPRASDEPHLRGRILKRLQGFLKR